MVDATKFLKLTKFNVEEAVNLYFTSKQTEDASSSNAVTDANDYGFDYEDEDEDDNADNESPVRAVIPAKRQRLLGY